MLLQSKPVNFNILPKRILFKMQRMDFGKYFRSNDDQESLESIICKYQKMPLEEKRLEYDCGTSFVVLDDMPFWPALYKLNGPRIKQAIERKRQEDNRKPVVKRKYYLKDESLPKEPFSMNNTINMKMSLWQGDITRLEIDAIVNAANNRCRGGGGVDGAIHKAAGYSFTKECITLKGCDTGAAKITTGHKLPAKNVIHTVGPFGKDPDLLKSCYKNCLQLVLKHGIKSVAFSCISTGVYGYPQRDAAQIALNTTRKWMEQHSDKIDRIIFCTFLSADFEIYQQLMAQHYFPCESIQKPIKTEAKDINNEKKVPLETDEADAYKRKVPSEGDDNSAEEHTPIQSEDLSTSCSKTNIDDSAITKFEVETGDTKTGIDDSAKKEGGVEMDNTKTDIDDSAKENVGIETADLCNNATKDILGNLDASDGFPGKCVETSEDNSQQGKVDASDGFPRMSVEMSEDNSQEIMDFGSQENENSSQQIMDLGSQQPDY